MPIELAIAVMWLFGVAISLAPVAVGLWQLRRLLAHALPWIERQSYLDALASDGGVRRRIALLRDETVSGPITCGVFRPAIIVPIDADQWTEDALRCALAHEVEHIQRNDWVMHCLFRIVSAAYWFHPLVWTLWRQVSLEAERACDDAVLRQETAVDYASLLVAVAQREVQLPHRPLLAMAHRGDLSRRIAAVMDPQLQRGRVGRAWAIGSVAGGALAILAIAPVTIAARMPQPDALAIRTGVGSSTGPLAAAQATQAPAAPLATDVGRRSPRPSGSMPLFEVVSIKENKSGEGMRGAGFQPGGRFVGRNVNVRMVIQAAYAAVSVGDAVPAPGMWAGTAGPLPAFQVFGGPDWIDSASYDIEAKASGPEPSPDAQRQMLRALLVDRFKMATRIEARDLPVYALVAARNDGKLGPQLTPAKGTNCIPRGTAAPDAKTPVCGAMGPVLEGALVRYTGASVPMALLASRIQLTLNRRVIDETGLSGLFDVTDFRFARPTLAPLPPDVSLTLDDTATSIFTALREQLGLKLDSKKARMDVLVIDRIERPTEN